MEPSAAVDAQRYLDLQILATRPILGETKLLHHWITRYDPGTFYILVVRLERCFTLRHHDGTPLMQRSGCERDYPRLLPRRQTTSSHPRPPFQSRRMTLPASGPRQVTQSQLESILWAALARACVPMMTDAPGTAGAGTAAWAAVAAAVSTSKASPPVSMS